LPLLRFYEDFQLIL